jgi:excinuclease ABC subunit C
LVRRLRKGKAVGDLPDLLVIDGGKGQLNVALAALHDTQTADVDVISLAKSRTVDAEALDRVEPASEGSAERPEEDAAHSPERVFLPNIKDPVVLKQNTSEIFLLARLRDEAHRFAITYHRKLRDRRTLRSVLDDIPGVGAARRRALLTHFGSLRKVKEASSADLSQVPGISPGLAERILASLNSQPLARGGGS